MVRHPLPCTRSPQLLPGTKVASAPAPPAGAATVVHSCPQQYVLIARMRSRHLRPKHSAGSWTAQGDGSLKMRRSLTTLTFSSQQQVRCLSIRLLAPALMRAAVAAIVGADIAPTCVAAKTPVIVHQLRLAFNFCAFNICAISFSYAFPVRYEEGGGIWPHTDVADNEITLTLQLQVKSPPSSTVAATMRLTTCHS